MSSRPSTRTRTAAGLAAAWDDVAWEHGPRRDPLALAPIPPASPSAGAARRGAHPPASHRPPQSALRQVVHVERRRPPRAPAQRWAGEPDRLALWALFMALALIVITALSA